MQGVVGLGYICLVGKGMSQGRLGWGVGLAHLEQNRVGLEDQVIGALVACDPVTVETIPNNT